jgi:shikimate kinase
MRPDPLAELQKLFAERREAYQTADHEVSTELHDLERVITMVTAILQRSPEG